MLEPIYEVEEGGVYYSQNSKTPYQVKAIGVYAHNCTITMVYFVNLKDTYDKPAGAKWMLEESMFLKTYLAKVTAH